MRSARRIAVLLGAGASKDAGLPLTDALAADMVRDLNVEHSDQRPAWLSALNFAYASIASFQARDGSSPFQSVNIERLISALRMLRRRDVHEAAPFVSSWREPTLPPGFVRAETHVARSLIANIEQAISGSRGSPAGDARQAAINAAYYVAEIAEFAKTPATPSAYGEADSQVLSHLARYLTPSESLDYLYPLLDVATNQPGGLDVISLNYDLIVEQAARQKGVAFDRGIDGWPDSRISFDQEAPLRLYKVHGSLDWALSSSSEFATPRFSTPKDMPGADAPGVPWIVVGDREKLATNGPTLELLHEAEDALYRADHLVVVGYGFADTHVNNMIRTWLDRDERRTLSIVDPSRPHADTRTFRGWLTWRFGENSEDPDKRRDSRIEVYQGGAGAMLVRAVSHSNVNFGRRPEFELMSVDHQAAETVVRMKLVGAELNNVWFDAYGTTKYGGADRRRVRIAGGAALKSRVEARRGDFEVVTHLAPDEHVTLAIDGIATGVAVNIQGEDVMGLVRRRVMLP